MKRMKCNLLIITYLLYALFPVLSQDSVIVSESDKNDFTRFLIQKNRISDNNIINALQNTGRDQFIPENMMDFLYSDVSIPVSGVNRRIASPSDIIKAITSAVSSGKSKALIIGNRGGYAASLLTFIYDSVFFIETDTSRKSILDNIFSENYSNVILSYGSDMNIFNLSGPFDFIFFHGSLESFPFSFLDNLSDNGILVFPLSDSNHFQTLIKAEKKTDSVSIQSSGVVFFPPLY